MRSVLAVVPAVRIEIKRRRLEDVFVSSTGTDGGSAGVAASREAAS